MARTSLVSLGSLIGDRFEVLRLVGSGGMGHVYRARDRATGRPVAVKVLHEASAAGRARFEREARLLAGLEHPAIVRHVASGCVDGEPEPQLYLAMEWIEGEDLGARLARGPLAPGDAVALALRVAEALAEAHGRGVVHRDVKPTNVLLEGGDPRQPRLADFGIAGGGALDARNLTATGATLGTPGFMAPEQIRGELRAGPPADVFSLGCVLWTALTGREPFAASTVIATLARVLFEPSPRLRDAWPAAPEALDALCARVLSREPADRPSDGAALASELKAVGALTLRSASLAPRATPSVLGEREQRLLSAVLVLTGAAALEGTVSDDPDETLVARSLGSLEVLGELARAFGAELEPVHGAAFLVAVRGDAVATDLGTRAARCALALRRELPGAVIAVATGRGTSRTGGSLGDVSDRAAALLDRRGEEAGILLDDATAALVADRLEVRRGASAWVLVGERAAWLEVRPVLGEVRPCLGRERELESMLVVADEALDEPCARACVLVGGAGFGKSRLRTELLRRLEGAGRSFSVWAARGDELAAGAPLAMVGELVRAAAGVLAGDALPVRRERLLALARGDTDRAAFLGEMSGIAGSGGGIQRGEVPALDRARLDPSLMADQLRRAFVETVLEACSARPLVLVLEDFHWGDLPSHELIEAALVHLAELPLLVLVTARPEVERVFPSLLARGQPWTLRVGPLTPRASAELVRGLLTSASEEVVARLVEGGAGQPLLLEEIARSTLEGGGDGEGSQRGATTLPESVIAMVQARIEALAPFDRKVLRAASVFGRTFYDGAVVALVGTEPAISGATPGALGQALDRLIAKEWLEARHRSRFPAERELGFRQDVVREAAYAMLTDADRRLGHRLAGDWLEAAGEDPLVLARHLEAGGELERAAGFFAAASELALDSGDFGAAVRLGTRAAELGVGAEALGAVRATQAEASGLRGDNEDAARWAREALALSPAGGLPWLRAAAAAANANGRLGDAEALALLAEALLAVSGAARTSGAYAAACSPTVIQLLVAGRRAEAVRLEAHLGAGSRGRPGIPESAEEAAFEGHLARARGAVRAFTGDPWGSVQHTRRAVPLFEHAGDPRLACLLAKTLGWYEGELGALEEAEQTLRGAVARATELRLEAVIPHAKHDLGSPLVRLGKLEEARALQEQAAAAFVEQRDRRLESGARALLSWIARAAGDLDAAERHAAEALAVAPSDPVRIPALAQLAAARLARREPARALEATAEALAVLERCGVTEEGVPLLRVVHAEALLAAGDEEGAREGVRVALRELDEKAARIGDAGVRERFLARIEENAKTLALAARLGLP